MPQNKSFSINDGKELQCKGCQKYFNLKSIFRHIGKNKNCSNFYHSCDANKEELQKMKFQAYSPRPRPEKAQQHSLRMAKKRNLAPLKTLLSNMSVKLANINLKKSPSLGILQTL